MALLCCAGGAPATLALAEQAMMLNSMHAHETAIDDEREFIIL
jgi:hypothetical protein